MRIYNMTATFGKLNHETLTLQPGLNVIEAPNEWGKSTWCAFLVNMLYGIDTKARSGGTTLVDKEHYAPWSGAPMSGRIELSWNGRDITIERHTKGRIPLGEFRAYETQTGIEVPELTAANCGQQLLGVERSVFARAGFIRLQDLPVTQDDSLRRRLNNLVTTGDENGAADRLGARLRDLKNKCRSNRANGLIPQAEHQRDQLLDELNELLQLQQQTQQLQQLQNQREEKIAALENHIDALHYEASRQAAQRVTQAQQECDRLQAELHELEDQCARLPSLQTAEAALEEGKQLQQQWLSLHQAELALPDKPRQPEAPQIYREMTPEAAVAQAAEDAAAQQALEAAHKKTAKLPLYCAAISGVLILGTLIAAAALQFSAPWLYILCGILVLLLCAGAGVYSYLQSKQYRSKMDQLFSRHSGITPDHWVAHAQAYQEEQKAYAAADARYQALTQDHQVRRQALEETIRLYGEGEPIEACAQRWEHIAGRHLALADKTVQLRNARKHAQVLQEMVSTPPPPQYPDTLTCPLPEAERLLEATRFHLQQDHLQLGQLQGRAQTLGQEASLRARLDQVRKRIARLEETYEALNLAQDALYQATTSLQRRFAPRISKRAQELFSQLTEGRYQRLSLGDDLSMSASAQDEDTLRSAQWRSDGTVDQLYLALRLAVATELTPQAPLVLDDALVRFDDRRLQVALALLQEEAENKQVLLFTCQGREKKLLSQ